jgi:hypothetical protein
VLNTIQFHSPLKSGYDFWIPHFGELLSPRYLPINADELWKRFALSPKPFEVANIFGTGTVFVPTFGALVLVGLCFLRLNRFVICAVLACVSFLTMTTSYKIFDSRFYLPLLIVLVAVAVLPVIWAAKNLLVKKHAAAALAIFVLFATACLGYPSRSGYNPGKVGRSQAWDALHFTVARRQSDRFLAQKHFVDRFGEESGIVLSDIDPAYLNALFPERMIAAPLDERHHYRYSKLWRYDRPQALALVTGGLQQALPIYALFTSMEEINTQRGRLPNVPGYEWVLAETPTADAAILKLTSK